MNPLKIFEYEPLDRSKLSKPAKVLVFFVEWIARFIAAVYISVILLILGIVPLKGMSKAFFRILGSVVDMYKLRYMQDEVEKDARKGLD